MHNRVKSRCSLGEALKAAVQASRPPRTGRCVSRQYSRKGRFVRRSWTIHVTGTGTGAGTGTGNLKQLTDRRSS